MWKLVSGETRLAGVIKSEFRQGRPKKTANHYHRGEFFKRYQLQKPYIADEVLEVDSTRYNFLSVESDSQGDQLNQTDVLPETTTKKKLISSDSSFRQTKSAKGQTKKKKKKSKTVRSRTPCIPNVWSFY